MAKMNLFELGKKLCQNQENLSNINTMLIFEPEDTSKETITNEYFDANNNTEIDSSTNLAIKYNVYSKQNNKQNIKDFCQVYKFKKNKLTIDLLKISLSNIKSSALTLVIVVDLGKLDNLLENLVDLVDKFKKTLTESMKTKLIQNSNYIEMISRYEQENKSTMTKAFPVPMMIIGCNLTKFLELDDQRRQIVQQFIRHFCLINFAQLYFLNEQSEYSVHRCKLLINHLAYERNLKESLKFSQMDKSLLVLFGQDKLENIYSNEQTKSWNEILELFRSKFAQKTEENTKTFAEKNRIDMFNEPDIDYIYSFNLQKLEFRQLHANN